MSGLVIDDKNIRDLNPADRLSRCESILRNENDESLRWDAVWLAGELVHDLNHQDPMYSKVADLMSWVLKNEQNGVVKHEACYQIAARNMRSKIPDLVYAALHDKSILAKHEALEALALMRANEAANLIKKAVDDPNPDVRETASFVLKRFKRLENKGEYETPKIL